MNARTAKISLGLNFILTLLLIYLLVQPDGYESYDTEKVKADVEDFLHEYHSSMENQGLKGEFAYLDSTEQFFWVPPGFNSWISFDSVKTILNVTDPLISEMKIRWEDLRIDVLSEEVAVYTGRVSIEQKNVNDGLQEYKLLETGIVKKKNGKWKILSGQSRVM